MASETQPPKRRWYELCNRLFGSLKKWIVLPLLGALLGVMVVGRLTNWIIGPKAYKVYVVGRFDDEAPRQIWGGLSDGSSQLRTLDGVNLELEKIDDLGDPLNARHVASEIGRRSDALLVVGHIYSTQTKEALPVYLQESDPPVPVILTTETNPGLLPPRVKKGVYYPVFRLSPTDDDQAERAVEFAISQGATTFWVVEDVSNPVYSSYLAQDFIRQIQQRHNRVLLWSNTMSLPPADSIRALKVNWVFFAGNWPNALILVQQLRAMFAGDKMPGILLSDGCMDQQLIDTGGADVDGVYLTHPLQAKTYALSNYGIYGKDAVKLIAQMVEETNDRFSSLAGQQGGFGYFLRRVLGIRRVKDARNALIAYMEESVRTGHEFDLTGGGRCQFRDDGTRVNTSFHVWTVNGTEFVDVREGGPATYTGADRTTR
jgi:branched-chain amino acid transport system substrate-binding protein